MLLVMVRIAFTDFWSEPKPFNPHNNFFVHALRAVTENVKVTAPETCDLLFYGPFGNEHQKFNHCQKVFYTGENNKPDFRSCSYSFSFTPHSHQGRNFRLPLWYLYIDWFETKTSDNPEWLIPKEQLVKPSQFSNEGRDKFCAIVYGKKVRSRIRAIEAISRYKKVDVFGKANPTEPIGEGEHAKLLKLSNYRFTLCYENSISLGYVTEKLLHGKIAGCIPIYYGDNMAAEDFNSECFIIAANLNRQTLIDTIREVDSSQRRYQSMLNEPLFKELPTLDPVYDALTAILNGRKISVSTAHATAAIEAKSQTNKQVFGTAQNLVQRISAKLITRSGI
jgi:hypothetical protein